MKEKYSELEAEFTNLFNIILPLRLRLLSGFLLSILLLYHIAESRQLFLYLKGDLTLIECLDGYIREDLEALQCQDVVVASSQQSTFTHLRILKDWSRSNYRESIFACVSGQCACSHSSSDTKAVLHERMRTYYSVLSYRADTEEYPEFDSCKDIFVPSNFIWYQSIQSKDREWADALWELAYLVNNGWQDRWQSGQVAFRQAGRYRDLGDVQAALQAFEVAVENLQRADDSRAEAYISWSLTSLGEIALEQQELSRAETRFRESIVNSPRNGADAFAGLVRVWDMQGLAVENMLDAFFEIRQSLGPDDPYLTSGPAQALLDAGADGAAWHFIETSSQEVQATAPVLGVTGHLHVSSGELEKARLYYRSALKQSIETEPLEAADRASDLAQIDEMLGDTGGAITNLELATQLNPRAAWYWFRLARLYEASGNLEKARVTIREALSLSPRNATFQKMLKELEN